MKKVKELLAKPEHWTKGVFALDKAGNSVDVSWPEACCFCLSGAVQRCYPKSERHAVWVRLYEAIRQHTGNNEDAVSVVGFNDDVETTHADVLSVLELADI